MVTLAKIKKLPPESFVHRVRTRAVVRIISILKLSSVCYFTDFQLMCYEVGSAVTDRQLSFFFFFQVARSVHM